MLQDNPVVPKYHQFLQQSHDCFAALSELKQQIVKLISYSSFEKTLNTNTYQLKCKIHKVIKEFEATLMEVNKDPVALVKNIDMLLAELVNNVQHTNQGVSHDLVKQIVQLIAATSAILHPTSHMRYADP